LPVVVGYPANQIWLTAHFGRIWLAAVAEFAQLFFVQADLVGEGVQGELLAGELGGEAGEGGGVACAAAVLVDDGAQRGVAVQRAKRLVPDSLHLQATSTS